jgi:hypothetical protein
LRLELTEYGALAEGRRLRFDIGEDGSLAVRIRLGGNRLPGLGGPGRRDQREHGHSHGQAGRHYRQRALGRGERAPAGISGVLVFRHYRHRHCLALLS